MKKFFTLFLSLCLIFILTACKQSNTPIDTSSYNIESEEISSNKETNETDNNESSTDEQKSNGPYPIYDIPSEFITTLGNKKVFEGNDITLRVPADWNCKMLNAEDCSIYYFRHPELGKKCEFSFEQISAELFSGERNQQEYLEYLTFDKRENVKIDSFTKEKVGGYQCRKVVSSYSLGNTEYIRIDYDYVIVGFKLYDFTIEYPASEREISEPIFESIINSIQFKTY